MTKFIILQQEDAIRKQQIIARKLEEIQEAEERKREEEIRKRQQAAAKRMAELEEAMERKRLEELEKRKQAALERFYYWDSPIVKGDYYRSGWNSRDYVNSALGIEGAVVGVGGGGGYVAGGRRNENYSVNVNLASSLEDLYYTAPLSTLAEVYRRLVFEKSRIKEVIKERISEGES